MKLAEALQERADLNRLIAQLSGRLDNNALVQEGEAPAEDPAELLAALDKALLRLEELMVHINLTNSRTLAGEETLTALLARRDCLSLRLRALQSLADSASRTAQRATRTEIKINSTVNVAALQKEIDGHSRALRLLDNAIQQANWTAELM